MESKASDYLFKLDEYEQEERKRSEEAGKIPVKKTTRCGKEPPVTASKRVSRTDPEAGFYKRKGKPEGMCYILKDDVRNAELLVKSAGEIMREEPKVQRVQELGL